MHGVSCEMSLYVLNVFNIQRRPVFGEEYSAMGLIRALYSFKVTDAGAL